MRRGHGHAEVRGPQDDGSGGRLGREAVHRVELDDALAHRPDDPPAAGRGTQRDRRGGDQDHQRRDLELWNDAGREQGEGHDAHRLLGVIRAVAERHERGRDDLEPSEALVDTGGMGTPEEIQQDDHEAEPDHHPEHGRRDQGKKHFADDAVDLERVQGEVLLAALVKRSAECDLRARPRRIELDGSLESG